MLPVGHGVISRCTRQAHVHHVVARIVGDGPTGRWPRRCCSGCRFPGSIRCCLTRGLAHVWCLSPGAKVLCGCGGCMSAKGPGRVTSQAPHIYAACGQSTVEPSASVEAHVIKVHRLAVDAHDGRAIQLANLPGSTTRPIRLATKARSLRWAASPVPLAAHSPSLTTRPSGDTFTPDSACRCCGGRPCAAPTGATGYRLFRSPCSSAPPPHGVFDVVVAQHFVQRVEHGTSFSTRAPFCTVPAPCSAGPQWWSSMRLPSSRSGPSGRLNRRWRRCSTRRHRTGRW